MNWLINNHDGPPPRHTSVGPGSEVVQNEAGPGDEISEGEAEVVIDLDDPPQSPEAPQVSPDVSTKGPEEHLIILWHMSQVQVKLVTQITQLTLILLCTRVRSNPLTLISWTT